MKLLAFGAPWCGPSKMMDAPLGAVKDVVEVERVNVDESPDLASRYNVRGVPTLLLLQGDTLLGAKVGACSEGNLREWIKGVAGE